MLRRPWARLAAAIGGGVAIAVAVPALPAVSQVSPPVSPPAAVDVELGARPVLVARGAAVAVPVTVTCAPGADFASVSVALTQRRGRFVATGFGTLDDIACTGGPATYEVFVSGTQRAFGVGPAFARADLSTLYGDAFVSDVDIDTLRLRRR